MLLVTKSYKNITIFFPISYSLLSPLNFGLCVMSMGKMLCIDFSLQCKPCVIHWVIAFNIYTMSIRKERQDIESVYVYSRVRKKKKTFIPSHLITFGSVYSVWFSIFLLMIK